MSLTYNLQLIIKGKEAILADEMTRSKAEITQKFSPFFSLPLLSPIPRECVILKAGESTQREPGEHRRYFWGFAAMLSNSPSSQNRCYELTAERFAWLWQGWDRSCNNGGANLEGEWEVSNEKSNQRSLVV